MELEGSQIEKLRDGVSVGVLKRQSARMCVRERERERVRECGWTKKPRIRMESQEIEIRPHPQLSME